MEQSSVHAVCFVYIYYGEYTVSEFPSNLKFFFEEGLLMPLGFKPSTYFPAFQNFQSFDTQHLVFPVKD